MTVNQKMPKLMKTWIAFRKPSRIICQYTFNGANDISKINRAGTEEDGQIAAGNITEETAPKYDGYTFVNATVGNDVIQYVGQYNDRVYYSIEVKRECF